MIPLSDENPTLHTPVMTWALLGAMFAVWLTVQNAGLNEVQLATSICKYGMVPGELTHRARIGTGVPIAPHLACVVDNDPINKLTPLTSMFLHGGWGHILGNALFFWVFGNNIEDKMGSLRYAIFYLLSGVVATLAHVAAQPDSTVPLIGASGAIAGVMGAYLVLFPRVRIRTVFIFFFILIRDVPAMWLLLAWFVLQFFTGNSSGVAWVAHVGGFAFGALVALIFRSRLQPGPPPAPPAWRGGY